MTGVVLSGGQSARMGSDKGLLPYGQQTWARQAFNKLASLQIPVILSVNPQQVPAYQPAFPIHSLITDHLTLAIGGPLKGLLSVHLQLPQEDLFVLACDMINMQVEVLDFLLLAYQQKNPEALIFVNKNQPEPLCGIYSADALNNIHHLYVKQVLHQHSMKYVLDQLDTQYLPVPGKWAFCFNNYNTPEDLAHIG